MSSINNKKGPPLPPQTPPQSDPEALANQGHLTKPSGKIVEQEQAEHGVELPTAKMSAADAERLVSQSGYSRVTKRRRGGVDLDDGGQGPVSLPVEEVDEQSWDQPTLDDAQEELTLQSSQLGQLAQELHAADGGTLTPLGTIAQLVQRCFAVTEEGVGKLQALENQATALPTELAGPVATIRTHFGIDMQAVDVGTSLLAATLVVAGHSDAVVPDGSGLEPARLTRGMHQVADGANNAVADARKMSSGINKQLAVHRTFMFKR